MRILLPLLLCLPLASAAALPNETPLAKADLDLSTFAEWVDGEERALDTEQKGTNPTWAVYTRETRPGHSNLLFGDSTTPGLRHLRIGFQRAVPIGTVFARGGGVLSFLKDGAAYPGDLSDQDQWLTAERLVGGRLSSGSNAEDDYAMWILPPGTETRALRFTHDAQVIDTSYAGRLSGVFVHTERLLDVVPPAVAKASSNPNNAGKIINGSHDGWKTWTNREKPDLKGDEPPVSAENPEWLSLTWPQEVTLDRLALLWGGVGAVAVQVPVTGGKAGEWKTIREFADLKNHYPSRFDPQFLQLDQPVTTRSLRLLITQPAQDSSHADTSQGRRVWLGEVIALRPLGAEPLPESKETNPSAEQPAPIQIPITLEKPGYVTLVIERPDGFRVRNLISETWFPAGSHTVGWDGTDDLGRDTDAAAHGVYRIPQRFVEPGKYRVRGLVRDEIEAFYEFSVYTTGSPPWVTEDHTGAWIANHTPPQAAAFVPAEKSPTGEPVVYLGAYVTEGPDGVAWVGLDGTKKGGQKWIGGHWTAAPFLAYDSGAESDPGTHVYVASAWETQKGSNIGELRITAMTTKGDREILKHNLGELAPSTGVERAADEVGGIAVHNQIAVVAMSQKNELLVVDTRDGKIVSRLAVPHPRGVAILPESGSILVLSGGNLLRFPASGGSEKPPQPQTVDAGLDDPHGLTLDPAGRIYISEHGQSHQVKVFSADGKLVRAIGHPGAPKAGAYDKLHMNHPHGLAVDSEGKLWVAENDYLPKRVSVWSPDGELVNAFYGPAKYGGGGALDPVDKTKFYYADVGNGSLEFALDWEKGSWELTDILARETTWQMDMPFRSASPEQALYHQGKRYFTNAFNSSPTGGHKTAFVFAERDGTVHPAAGMGEAKQWDLLKSDAFRSRWPEGADPEKDPCFFIWSDANEDAIAQPGEVVIHMAESVGGVTVQDGLTFCIARLDGRALALPPIAFSDTGVPRYELAESTVLAVDVQSPASSGGDQVLFTQDGDAVVTLGIAPFHQYSLSGAKDGVAKWSYPSVWPGLHASHQAPVPDRLGQLTGTTRLPGGFFEVEGAEVGPLWMIHGNHGEMWAFTADGLFVASLFEDMRQGVKWRMPQEKRGMNLKGLSIGEENFWPTLTHSSEGKVYLVDGDRSAIIRLEGFDSLRRIDPTGLDLTPQLLEKCSSWALAREAERQKTGGADVLAIALGGKHAVDGDLTEWEDAQWAMIDQRGVKAYFNSDSKPYDVQGAIAVSGERLFAAWKTGNPALLANSNEMPLAPFKTGGAIDLMFGPSGDRDQPAAGDMRLLVTEKDGKPRAILYRAVVPGTEASKKIPFSSPWRTITFDEVTDVSDEVELAGKDGNFEISVPISLLGFNAKSGGQMRGDIGILRGSGGETNARVYWHNKATGITADVPSEAQLAPALWGTLRFEN